MSKITVFRDGIKIEIDGYINNLKIGDIICCKIPTPRSCTIKKVKIHSFCRDLIFVMLIDEDKILSNYKDPTYRKKSGDIFGIYPGQVISYSN